MRRISYRPRRGRETIVLLTTILDPAAASAKELVAAYHDRWEGESAFDEIKTHLCDCATVNRPVVFRSKTPSRVEQEFYGLLIAFNVPITEAQQASITVLTGIIFGLITRTQVTPMATLPAGGAGEIADAKAANAARKVR